MVLDKVIVLDNVSGLSDRSNEFANFLTVSRKYGVTCVFIFHTIYPTRENWQMIMSQIKIFKFFPGSVLASSIKGILSSFASGYSNNYITTRNIWINELYFDISILKHVILMTYVPENVEVKPTAKQKKYAIMMEIKRY